VECYCIDPVESKLFMTELTPASTRQEVLEHYNEIWRVQKIEEALYTSLHNINQDYYKLLAVPQDDPDNIQVTVVWTQSDKPIFAVLPNNRCEFICFGNRLTLCDFGGLDN